LGTGAAGVETGGATFPFEVVVVAAAAEAEDEVGVGVEELRLSVVAEATARGFPAEEGLMLASMVATAVSPASCSVSCLLPSEVPLILSDGDGSREGREWV